MGTLVSPNPASLLKIDAERHERIIQQTEIMSDFAAEFALQYRTRALRFRAAAPGLLGRKALWRHGGGADTAP